jgi:diguanylate cyclase (GGDEF)-like protein
MRPIPYPRWSRDLWASLLPTVGAVLLLALAGRSRDLSNLDLLGGSWATFGGAWWFLGLLAAGAAGAFHRPFNRTTLGLGAAVVAPAVLLFGAVTAAGLAAVALLMAEISWRVARAAGVVQLPERRKLLRALEAAGLTAIAVLAAGAAWTWLPRLLPGGSPGSSSGAGGASGAAGPPGFAGATFPGLSLAARIGGAAVVYLVVWAALLLGEQKLRRPDQVWRPRALLPLLTDAAGWIAGTGVALAGVRAGWPIAGLLLGGLTLVALESGRNGLLLAKARRRAGDLERLRRAGTRIITPEQEMAGVVERILAECEVVQFQWFQFELMTPGSELKSWWSSPRRQLSEGVPEPDAYPPALPGFHRRSNWQILERTLRDEGRILARLRLWCDPRQVEPPAVQMLDRLLPQMSASVRRCLLDREAREDPLTGVAMRRVLEQRLHQAHAQCLEEGGAMSVILCDLDHFKRINDTYGHPAGDTALIAVANALKQDRRDTDLCCRYGGEEFVVLLEGTAGDVGLLAADRIRQRIESLDFRVEGERVPLTLSAGVACFPDLYIKTAAELLLFADEALYEAKRRGRNRCLLDLGQGRYLDVAGSVYTTEESPPPAVEPPRIFA